MEARVALGIVLLVALSLSAVVITAILLTAEGMDDAARGQKQQPLEKRMRDQMKDRGDEATDASAKELTSAGLHATSRLPDGDPKRVLVDEAESFHADCIFLGARGLGRRSGSSRPRAGSVPATAR